MNFHDLIVNRRSIRKYTSQPISPEDVKTILESALLAPSSKSTRAWQLIAVEDKALLESLSQCRPSGAGPVKDSTLTVVVTVDSTKSGAWMEDASIAATYMQLQAAALGIGSCWIQVYGRFHEDGTPSDQYVQELLGIPETCSVLCMVTMGYADETRKPQDVEKLKWESVHIGKW